MSYGVMSCHQTLVGSMRSAGLAIKVIKRGSLNSGQDVGAGASEDKLPVLVDDGARNSEVLVISSSQRTWSISVISADAPAGLALLPVESS